MKTFNALLLLIAFLPLSAQVADKSVSDCSGSTRSIYGVLGSGKVLLVASKGLDCSICKNSAPDVQNFAGQNQGRIEVWGAMTYTFNANTPTCAQVANWVSTYNWTDIFTFVDSDRHWFMTGTPRYIVYDPSDNSEAYNGPNKNTAFQTATSLANSIGVTESSLQEIEISQVVGGIEIKNLPFTVSFNLYSLTGKEIFSGRMDENNNRISTESLKSGIYLLRLQGSGGAEVVRKLFVN